MITRAILLIVVVVIAIPFIVSWAGSLCVVIVVFVAVTLVVMVTFLVRLLMLLMFEAYRSMLSLRLSFIIVLLLIVVVALITVIGLLQLLFLLFSEYLAKLSQELLRIITARRRRPATTTDWGGIRLVARTLTRSLAVLAILSWLFEGFLIVLIIIAIFVVGIPRSSHHPWITGYSHVIVAVIIPSLAAILRLLLSLIRHILIQLGSQPLILLVPHVTATAIVFSGTFFVLMPISTIAAVHITRIMMSWDAKSWWLVPRLSFDVGVIFKPAFLISQVFSIVKGEP